MKMYVDEGSLYPVYNSPLNVRQYSRRAWRLDEEDDGYEITNKEIVAIFKNTNEIGDEATVNEPLESVSHDDAVKALEVATAYVENQGIECMML